MGDQDIRGGVVCGGYRDGQGTQGKMLAVGRGILGTMLVAGVVTLAQA
jgi:hypothetical protein